jgi:hypothetical protein
MKFKSLKVSVDNMKQVALATLLISQIMMGTADASVISSWDWNDGTIQDWSASPMPFNVTNQLGAINSVGGSLQIYSPDILASDITVLSTISFDLMIQSYDTVSSPSQLTGILSLMPLYPGAGLHWDLDLTGLAFNQWRTFNVAIGDATGTSPLASNGFAALSFTDSNTTQNSSSALIDNFVLSSADTISVTSVPAPAPAAAWLFASGLLGLVGFARRKAS